MPDGTIAAVESRGKSAFRMSKQPFCPENSGDILLISAIVFSIVSPDIKASPLLPPGFPCDRHSGKEMIE